MGTTLNPARFRHAVAQRRHRHRRQAHSLGRLRLRQRPLALGVGQHNQQSALRLREAELFARLVVELLRVQAPDLVHDETEAAADRIHKLAYYRHDYQTRLAAYSLFAKRSDGPRLFWYQCHPYEFKPHERPFMPGSPATPDHPLPRRIAYLLIGILLGIEGRFANGLLLANIQQIQVPSA